MATTIPGGAYVKRLGKTGYQVVNGKGEPLPHFTYDPKARQILEGLPNDFPGREALLAAEIDALSKVPTDRDTLITIENIGEKTADKILARL